VPGDHRVVARHGKPQARRLSGITIEHVNRAYAASTRTLAVLQLVLGVAIVVSAVAHGGGPLALGVVLGTMLALFGAGRLWLGRGGER
jgi:hypothetical protein